MGGSSPSPEQIEVAELLMRRAESDVRACRRLAGNPEMDDDVVGFHTQQAVEKAVKAALILRGVDFPTTHDLDFLLARAGAVGWARSMLGR
jgi:HEPN domain-containing protein